MSAQQQQQTPPKRPRLSLQIKAISSGPNLRASRTIAAVVNPTSPTSFNTLSNVYATAIDRATPVTAINTHQPLKLQTQNIGPNQQYGAPTPYASAFLPETPLTAQPISPAVAGLQDFRFPSTMTATPPLSAGAVENDANPFFFSAVDTANATTPAAAVASDLTPTTGTMRRRATLPPNISSANANFSFPYARNRSLHSILRNSPLPPPTARTPTSPRRQSLRLAEKAARRVGYESPIERVITTNEYVRPHVDLLLADDQQLSPWSMSPTSAIDDMVMAGNETSGETRDGGQTPGPFEEMRRRMAGLVARTPTSSPSCSSSPAGIKKRRRKDRGRRWVWTIGNQEDDDEDEREVGGAIAATRAAASRAQRASSVFPSGCSPSSAQTTSPPPPRPFPLEMTTMTTMSSPMEIPTPSIETFDEAESTSGATAGTSGDDVVMSESEAETETDVETPSHDGQGRGKHNVGPSMRRTGPPDYHNNNNNMDLDTDMMDTMLTPTVVTMPARRRQHHHQRQLAVNFLGSASRRSRSVTQESDGLFNSETGSRRDTPIPADLVPTVSQ